MRCAIFDLDGTLVDTSVDLVWAANAALAEIGLAGQLDPVADAGTAFPGAAAPLVEVVTRAGGRLTHAALIGDTSTDRETARAAGVASIMVTFRPDGRGVAERGRPVRWSGSRICRRCWSISSARRCGRPSAWIDPEPPRPPSLPACPRRSAAASPSRSRSPRRGSRRRWR